MAGSALSRFGEALRAFRDVFRNPNLRRLEATWATAITAEWAFGIGLSVYAYAAGGVVAVGLVGFIRTVPAFFTAPFASLAADRLPRERVLLVALLLRVATLAAASALAFAHRPEAFVYGLAALDAAAHSVYWPTQAALLPLVATTPEELTAANVAYGAIGGIGALVGPAGAGLLLALSGDAAVFTASAALLVVGSAFAARIRSPRITRREPAGATLARQAMRGFDALRRDEGSRAVVLLYVGEAFVWGAFSVLVVAAAIGVLGLGRPGVGYLDSMMGVGSLVGSIATLALVGRRRMAVPFGIGILLWGLPVLLIGALPAAGTAFALLAVIGAAGTVVDVAALTLLQRIVAEDVLGRVLGILEGTWWGASGLGALAASGLATWLGVRGALVVIGALLPVLTALSLRRLLAIDRQAVVHLRELEVLAALPIFAPLPVPTLERLARHLDRISVEEGEVIIRQGEVGTRFYVIGEGRALITQDGRPINSAGPGDHFGEIALLRNVPRTATVTAQTPMELYALEWDEFVGAVTGHPASRRAADAVVGARLGTLRDRMGPP